MLPAKCVGMTAQSCISPSNRCQGDVSCHSRNALVSNQFHCCWGDPRNESVCSSLHRPTLLCERDCPLTSGTRRALQCAVSRHLSCLSASETRRTIHARGRRRCWSLAVFTPFFFTFPCLCDEFFALPLTHPPFVLLGPDFRG